MALKLNTQQVIWNLEKRYKYETSLDIIMTFVNHCIMTSMTTDTKQMLELMYITLFEWI